MRLPAAAALLASLTLAACGGDDAEPLSASEYRGELKTVCTALTKETQGIGEPEDGSGKALKASLQQVEPVLAKAVGDVEDLEPPKELRKDHDAFVTASETQLKELRGLRDAVDAGKPLAGQRELLPKVEAFTKASQGSDAAADRLGVPACAGA